MNMAGYQSIGLTADEIETIRQDYIHADPKQIAGSPRAKLTDLVNRFANLGQRLLYPEVFAPSFSVGGSAGLRPEAVSSGNSMAQINRDAHNHPAR